MSERFIATYKAAVQISYDDYRLVATSKVFSIDDSFTKIIEWLKVLGVKTPKITDVDFSYLDETNNNG